MMWKKVQVNESRLQVSIVLWRFFIQQFLNALVLWWVIFQLFSRMGSSLKKLKANFLLITYWMPSEWYFIAHTWNIVIDLGNNRMPMAIMRRLQQNKFKLPITTLLPLKVYIPCALCFFTYWLIKEHFTSITGLEGNRIYNHQSLQPKTMRLISRGVGNRQFLQNIVITILYHIKFLHGTCTFNGNSLLTRIFKKIDSQIKSPPFPQCSKVGWIGAVFHLYYGV